MQTKHSFKYWQWRVIICSMIGYSMFYFVRKNFSFAMPALSAEYGITNTDFGIILTLVGIIGLMSYGSVIITGAGLGWFSDHFGWDYLFILMAGFAVVGGLLVATLWNIKDDGYIHE